MKSQPYLSHIARNPDLISRKQQIRRPTCLYVESGYIGNMFLGKYDSKTLFMQYFETEL